MTLDRPEAPVKTYQVWSATKPLQLFDAQDSFTARKLFAKEHSLEVTDVSARRLDLGVVPR